MRRGPRRYCTAIRHRSRLQRRKNHEIVKLLLVPVARTFHRSFKAAAATLVEKGEAHAVIIVPGRASPVVQSAARVLRDHIKQMSGAELPIRTEDKITGAPSQDEAWLLVGESKLPEKLGLNSKGLGAGGILLSARDNVIAIIGSDSTTDPFGTRYAVTTFLEDNLGVRYLWPGELGKVVPHKETVTVADFEHRFTPKLAQRRIRSMGYHDHLQVGLDNLGFTKADYETMQADARRTQVESPDWFGWHRLGGTLNMNGGHAFGNLWEKYGKDHPCVFYATIYGKSPEGLPGNIGKLTDKEARPLQAIAWKTVQAMRK